MVEVVEFWLRWGLSLSSKRGAVDADSMTSFQPSLPLVPRSALEAFFASILPSAPKYCGR